MSSVYWRADRNRWYVSYKDCFGEWKAKPLNDLQPDFPQRKRLTKPERIQADAAAHGYELEQQPVTVGTIDLETAAAMYIDAVTPTLSHATVTRYKSTIASLLAWKCPNGERVALRAITTIDLRQWRDNRLRKHSANTVVNDIKALSAVFAWCWRQDWIDVNPVDRVERPRKERTHVEVPSEARVLEMLTELQAEHNDRFYLLAILGALAGLRIGDILWLKPEHVDMERRLLRIYHGKSRKPRVVPMHPEIHRFLMDWPIGGDWLYPMDEFKSTPQYRSDRPGKNFNHWLRKHGYPWTHKSLRHFFNDALRRRGVGDAVRLAVMGHADGSTNLIYSHPQVDELRPVLEGLCRPSPPDAPPAGAATPP